MASSEKQAPRRQPESQSRIPENSVLYGRIIPATLLVAAVVTVGLILFAAAVLLGLVNF